jgi:hypothetical protein
MPEGMYEKKDWYEKRMEAAKKMAAILFIFMIFSAVVLILFASQFVQERIPECQFELGDVEYSAGKNIGSKEEAMALIQEYLAKDVVLEVEELYRGFYTVSIMENEAVVDKYGVTGRGEIYSYKKFCPPPEEEVSFFERIKRAFELILQAGKNETAMP